MDEKAMLEGLQLGMIASDANFKITYINKRGEELFKLLLNAENLVGTDMHNCHQPETIEKLKVLYQDFREKKKALHYYVMDGPNGKLTIVSVPYYAGDEFAGAVEYIFESELG